MSILDSLAKPTQLNKLIEEAYPGLASKLSIHRPKTQQTVIEMLNTELLTPDGESLKQQLDDNDKVAQKFLKQAYQDMSSGRQSQATDWLNAVRTRIVDVGMWSTPGWFQFFDFVRLAEDERPQVQQDYENEFEVIVLGQESGVEVKRYVRENDSFRDINMVFRSTREIRYTLMNANDGRFTRNKPAISELERAHQYILNELSGDAVAAALGAFPTALGEQSFFLHNQGLPHSSFKNVPTTNDLDLSAEGAITKEVFLAIFDYMDRMPSFGLDQGSMAINTIHVPSVDLIELNRFVSVVTAFTGTADILPQQTFSPAFQAELEKSGFPASMFGRSFTIVPDKTLPAKFMYISFNQPAGQIYEKPSMTMIEDSVEVGKNLGKVRMTKVYAAAIEPHGRPNVLRVKYKV